MLIRKPDADEPFNRLTCLICGRPLTRRNVKWRTWPGTDLGCAPPGICRPRPAWVAGGSEGNGGNGHKRKRRRRRDPWGKWCRQCPTRATCTKPCLPLFARLRSRYQPHHSLPAINATDLGEADRAELARRLYGEPDALEPHRHRASRNS